MLRYLFVFVTVLPFMFIFNTTEVKKEELKVGINTTNSAEPETEFTVKLKITGGDVKGFAKYTDRMPEGTEAIAVSIGDATFTADNGQIKIIWIEFPKEDEVIVEYKVKLLKSAPSSILTTSTTLCSAPTIRPGGPQCPQPVTRTPNTGGLVVVV